MGTSLWRPIRRVFKPLSPNLSQFQVSLYVSSKDCVSAFTSRSNVCTSNLRSTSILRPPDNITANPQLDSLCATGFAVANSTPSNLQSARVLFLFLFHRRFFR